MEVEGQEDIVDSSNSGQFLMDDSERVNNAENEPENSNKRLREEVDQEDLFDDLDDEVEHRHRRLKKKKKGSEQEKPRDEIEFDDAEIEAAAAAEPEPEPELEPELEPESNHQQEPEITRKTLDEDDEDEDDEDEGDSKLGSKQLQSELFADDNDSDEMVHEMLPQDFPDDLSEEGINKEAREAERRAYVSDEDFSDEERLGDFIVDAQGMPVRMAKEQPRRLGSGAITSEQLGIAHDIFGDYPDELFGEGMVDEEEEIDSQLSQFNSTNELRQEAYRLLAKRLDPEEIINNYASIQDDMIVRNDIPERIQLRTPDRPVPDDQMIAAEAEWIYDMVFAEQLAKLRLEKDIVIECITNVLRLMLIENLEIPYIATYRKEFWNTSNPNPQVVLDEETGAEPAPEPTLEASHLWDIYDWDEKWYSFQKKKNNVLELYRSVAEVSASFFFCLF